MSFFQKKPQVGLGVQFYTLGQQNLRLIVGLGNIGQQFEGTRHNIGFACVDRFAREYEFDPWIEKKDLKCHITEGRLGETRVIVIKPTTLMNLSGQAVQAVMHFYKIHPDHVLVVHDELDIPFGQIRTRIGGGSAGHNGIKSVSSAIGENYGRVRVGIGPKHPEQIDSSDFVLGKFDQAEQDQIKNLTREVDAIVSEYIFGGQPMTETRSFLV